MFSGIKIRAAGKKDSLEIFYLTKKYFPYTNFSISVIENRLNSASDRYIVAAIGNKAIGFSHIVFSEKRAQIMGIAVLEAFRGAGIGKKLLERSLKECKRKEVKQVNLLAAPSNSIALSMYSQKGFNIKGQVNLGFKEPTLVLSKKL